MRIVLLTSRATMGLGGHEEVHLTVSQLLNVVFVGVYARCINCFLRKTVPSIYAALREEVMTDFWLVLWLRQLPAVSTSTVGNSRPTENFQETAVKPLNILKSSITSALLQRFSRDHNPSLLSLSLYGNVLGSRNILVNRCWTHSNKTLSLSRVSQNTSPASTICPSTLSCIQKDWIDMLQYKNRYTLR